MRTLVAVGIGLLALTASAFAADGTSPSNFAIGTTSTPLTVAGKPILSRQVPAGVPFFYGLWIGTASLDGDAPPVLAGPRSAFVTVELPAGITLLSPAPVPGSGLSSTSCLTDCLLDMGSDGRRIRANAFYRLVASAPGTYRIVARITSTNRPDPDLTDNEADFVFSIVTAKPKLELGHPVPKPERPRAGGSLTLSVPVALGGAATRPSRVKCTATLAGKPLAGRAVIATGRATCVWKLPSGTTGKLLSGAVTVTAGGATGTRSRAVRVA